MNETIHPGREFVFGIFPPYFIYTLLTVLAIALIFYWLIRAVRKKEGPDLELKRRYARGEIDEQTYRDMLKEMLE